ncbi:DUF2029 domain-containing protein [Rubrobacter tropicus]|uniref:DUF2029 domain-containing protein n=1 Tax=Rubrobacter tropicus TaxID=2653851 RepID=A0A6G8Q7T0_9ACTN|nr:glycosyltransferase family 87 protein [Rubrobacter tropicus]QIN82544.1 DUF2029 domain-containing protein [Rubrobacter tropicus]
MPLALLGAVLYGAVLGLSESLPPDLREGSNDLGTYHGAGEAILRGEIPYRDFFIEYPPGSLPAFLPPALFSDDRRAFVDLFSSEMALVLVAALFLVALTARRLGRAWPVPALTFTAGALLLYPVAVTRYDPVVTLSLAVAVLGAALGGRYRLLSYASLGFGAAAKLVPALAVLPLVLARRGAGLAIFFGVLALFFVPALAFGDARFVESFAYHADRGLQVESVAASVLLAAGKVEGVAFEFGAFEARGPAAGLAAGSSLPVSAALLAFTAFVMYRRFRREGPESLHFPRWAAALILAFMLGSKVLSPQYVLWLLPLVPICAGGPAGAGISIVFLAACWTTTQVFPTHYDDLLNLRYPGPQLLLLRNALLVALWGLLLLPIRQAGAKGVPS